MIDVLVTGASGWLGSRLVEVLRHGLPGDERFPALPELRVRGLVMDGEDASDLRQLDPSLEIVEGDVRDEASLRRFMKDSQGAVLFHTAGVIHPSHVTDFDSINTRGTQNVLTVARGEGVRRVVHVSSNSPFGFNASPDALFDESSPYRPYRGYGRSKMRAEQAVMRAHENGLETVIVRPPWFYGPRQPARQTRFFELVRAGRFPLVGDGTQRRSMVHIDNLCEGLLLAGREPVAAGRAWWVADERPYPLREIVETVRRVLEEEVGGTRRPWLRLPRLASDAADLIDGAMQRLGAYEQSFHVLAELGHTIACDVSRTRVDLGYRGRVSLEEGMRDSVRWLIARGWRPD